MSAQVLLTGATGLIGFRVLLAVLEAGHSVRYTARSEEKAKRVTSNPAIHKLSPGGRLTAIVVPDMAAKGAYDTAMEGITHVVHVGSPVPMPSFDPMKQVYVPTVNASDNILRAALKTPSVRRIVLTSSIVANMSPKPDPNVTATPDTKIDTPGFDPSLSLSAPEKFQFANVFEAYIVGKIHERYNTDRFVQEHNPHFTVSHVVPGYVFGKNELVLNSEMVRSANSSNNVLLEAILGGGRPVPIHGGYAHTDDVADVHLKVLFQEPREGDPKNFAICSPVVYDDAFPIVAKTFPEATEEGIFSRGKLMTLPISYDASQTEKTFGIKFRSFESALTDLAGQYLEVYRKGVGKERL